MKLKTILEYSNQKYIDVSYEIVTPESAEYGDAEERGWEEQNVIMEPDEYDRDDDVTAVDNAVDFIQDRGPVEASSSHFHTNVWYTTSEPEQNRDYFEKGEHKTYSFHLHNFTEDEEEEIFNRLTAR